MLKKLFHMILSALMRPCKCLRNFALVFRWSNKE